MLQPRLKSSIVQVCKRLFPSAEAAIASCVVETCKDTQAATGDYQVCCVSSLFTAERRLSLILCCLQTNLPFRVAPLVSARPMDVANELCKEFGDADPAIASLSPSGKGDCATHTSVLL